MMAKKKHARFPGETTKYRTARNRLLEKEIKLRRELEKVAADRRKLPLGGQVFGPRMPEPCPYCSSILDGVDGAAPHVGQRVNLAIVARSPIDRVLTFARERGWRHLRLLSSAGNSYNHDYHGENEAGDQLPMMNVFTRRRGRVYHTWATELFFATPDRGQDNRHVDLIWPVWNLLDMTPEGRGAKWGPKLRY
jgi:predicted dithiol-disulfide oxidoreductase (DUF899 family)